MKTLRIIIALFIIYISTLAAYAEGYSMLVIPKSSISLSKRITFGNVDIEELLARKFIDRLEDTDIGYAPSLRVLKISINNNSAVNLNDDDYLKNIKAISRAYGVPRVLYIHSKKELINNAKQKEFWNKMDLPVLTQSEISVKVTTYITLYDVKKDEIVYTDVYYKKMNLSDGHGTNDTKLSTLNSYYDELISKVFTQIKESKETHAIMVSDKLPQYKESQKPTNYTEPGKDVSVRKLGFVESMKIKYNEKKTDREIEKINKEAERKVATKKIEPKFSVKEEQPKEEKTGFMTKLKESLQPKEDTISQEQKKLEKQIDLDRKNDLKIREKKEQEIIKEQEKAKKTAQKLLKEQQKKADKEQKTAKQKNKLILQPKKNDEPLWTIPIKKIEPDETVIAEKTKQVEEMAKSNSNNKIRLKEDNTKQTNKKLVLKTPDSDKKAPDFNKAKTAEIKPIKIKEVRVKNTDSKISVKEKNVKPQKVQNKEPKVKQVKVKQDKPKLSERIKNKIKDYKEKQALKNAEKVLAKEKQEAGKPKDIVVPIDVNSPSANRYIQTRIRNNAKFYTPRYDYSVNDI